MSQNFLVLTYRKVTNLSLDEPINPSGYLNWLSATKKEFIAKNPGCGRDGIVTNLDRWQSYLTDTFWDGSYPVI